MIRTLLALCALALVLLAAAPAGAQEFFARVPVTHVAYYGPVVVPEPVAVAYAPVPVVAYFRAPVVAYYRAPAVAYYPAPVCGPVPAYVTARPVIVRQRVYVPGQPVRNALRVLAP
jgi:hypothetical protein